MGSFTCSGEATQVLRGVIAARDPIPLAQYYTTFIRALKLTVITTSLSDLKERHVHVA